MPDLLRAGTVLSALFALVSLTILVARTSLFGRRPFYSKDAGSKVSGIMYAFGKGMMPWEKESARKHLLTYLAGVAYHAGILAAIFYLFCGVFSISLPWFLLQIMRAALFAGGACGLSLLLKRILSRNLRKLSCPDDYAANILVTLFVVVAAVHAAQLLGWHGLPAAPSPAPLPPTGPSPHAAISPAPAPSPESGSSSILPPSPHTAMSPAPAVDPGSFVTSAFYVVSTIMFLYVPVGKIRHCFFFFYSRVLLGIFFGRRSALPTR